MTRNTTHTLRLMTQWFQPQDAVLDIGCDKADVAHHLEQLGFDKLHNVDFVDTRRFATRHFALFDGIHLPFEDESFDGVSLNFVLHHVDNRKKLQLLNEVRRVLKKNGKIFILEDTPRNVLDWLIADLHGRYHRRKIGSREGFGFLSQRGWEKYFADNGFQVVASQRQSRFCRNRKEPYARSLFVVQKRFTA